MRFKFILPPVSQHWGIERRNWRGQKRKGAAGNGACRTHAKLPPVAHICVNAFTCVCVCVCVCVCGKPVGKKKKENKENNARYASLHIYLSCQVIPCNYRNCVKLFNSSGSISNSFTLYAQCGKEIEYNKFHSQKCRRPAGNYFPPSIRGRIKERNKYIVGNRRNSICYLLVLVSCAREFIV